MSTTYVDISIADGNARRHLHIFRTNPAAEKLNDRGWRDLDDVSNYRVEVEGGRGRDYSQSAEFFHRYGDSEMSLVGEAILALTGHLPQRNEAGEDKA